MGAGLGHAPLEGRGGMVDVPPDILAPGIATVAGHDLGVETGAQILSRNGIGDGAPITIIKNTRSIYLGRFVPKAPQASKVAAQIIHRVLLYSALMPGGLK